ncbi:efflux transporter outer membrane subunit [Agrobacterium tumefaciens]|uniref:efflux transporter outer membrane subunit n=1 Tax=Agrobacterium tumefaciens TaxID=358 RepID=UPI0030135A15
MPKTIINQGPLLGCVRLSVIGTMVATLVGCVVGPDYQTPKTVHLASWASAKKAERAKPPELTQWWRKLNDPLLDDLIAQAIEKNLDVASAKARVREARAAYRQQTGALLPTLDGSASTTRSKSKSSDENTISTEYQIGFDANWEIDLFGANRRAAEAARYSAEAADEDLRDAYVTLIGDVASYYIQAREYQALITLAGRTARSQRETASLTRKQQEAGDATSVDTATADAQAASTEADIPSYRISYQHSVHRLSVLLGNTPSALQQLMDKPVQIPSPTYPVNVGIPADVLHSRPDVRSAERQLAQYTAKIGQAEAARYPTISLTGDIASSAASISDLAQKSSISWSFGPTISIPLFKGGQLKAAVDVAKAQRDQYFVAYQSAVLSAMEDVENAIVALNQSQQRRAKLSASVAAYRQAVQLAHALNKAGMEDLLDVLESERDLYSTEEDLIESKANIATYYVSLHKALGGGWEGNARVEKPAVVDTDTGPRIASR